MFGSRSGIRSLYLLSFSVILLILIAIVLSTLRPGQDPNIILITIDTIRADHLSCYDYTESETPNIDTIAADGVLFENAITPVPLTLPAHASLFTGTYPPYHGIRHNRRFSLPEDRETLPEILAQAGYNTTAVVGAFILDSMFGLDQGFQRYDDTISARPSYLRVAEEIPERLAEDVVKATLEILEGDVQEPLFLWIHFFDPHFPYMPPSPYAEQFFEAPYDGEIKYVDDQIGLLLRDLESKEIITPESILIIAGDHGESLGDHGEVTHGAFIYESTLRIPLIVKSPKLFAPKRVAQEISLVDIAPTLLDLLGLPQRKWMQGESLAPLLTEANARNGGDGRMLYLETLAPYYDFVWAQLSGIRSESWKYIEAPQPELYNLRSDPGETNNLVTAEPARTARLRQQLRDLLPRLQPERVLQSAETELNEEALAKLRALGYIGGGNAQPPPDDIPLKDPKEMVQQSDIMVRFFDGVNLLWQRRYRDAIALFEPLLNEGHPLGTQLRFRLAMAYHATGEYQRAIEVIEPIQDLRQNPDLLAFLAVNYGRVGRTEEALELLRDGHQRHPWNKNILDTLSSFYLRRGQLDDARWAADALLELDPSDYRPRTIIASIEHLQGNTLQAVQLYREVLRENPRNTTALLGLAEIYADQGEIQPAMSHYQRAYSAAPGNAEVSYRFGSFLLRIGRKDMAKRFFETYLSNASFDDLDRRQRVQDLLHAWESYEELEQ